MNFSMYTIKGVDRGGSDGSDEPLFSIPEILKLAIKLMLISIITLDALVYTAWWSCTTLED